MPGHSFLDLRTILAQNQDSIEDITFHDAARARGLITTGDEEYTMCMEEASLFQVGGQLRALFVTLILDGAPAPKIWREFKDHLIGNLLTRLTTADAIQAALREIDLKLQLHGK